MSASSNGSAQLVACRNGFRTNDIIASTSHQTPRALFISPTTTFETTLHRGDDQRPRRCRDPSSSQSISLSKSSNSLPQFIVDHLDDLRSGGPPRQRTVSVPRPNRATPRPTRPPFQLHGSLPPATGAPGVGPESTAEPSPAGAPRAAWAPGSEVATCPRALRAGVHC